jgi:hypothetical protein
MNLGLQINIFHRRTLYPVVEKEKQQECLERRGTGSILAFFVVLSHNEALQLVGKIIFVN